MYSRRSTKELMWTIEWIQEDGSKVLQHRCSDSSTLQEIYDRLPDRLKIAPRKAGKKRKRTPIQSSQVASSTEANESSSAVPKEDIQENIPQEDAPVVNVSALVTYDSDAEDAEESRRPAEGKRIADDKDLEDDVQKNEGEPEASSTQAVDEKRLYFYLVKPKTSGKQRVLIRTKPKQKLEEILQRQEVLEFPTFQVLPNHWKSLPDDYILDINYTLKMRIREEEMKKLVDASEDLLQEVPDSSSHAPRSNWAVKPDQEIFAMLQKDIGRK